MHHARTSLVAAVLLLLGTTAAAQARTPASPLDLRSAVPMQVAPGVAALTIDYRYVFPGRSTVHIDGLGDAPASGAFRYVTREPSLSIRDRRGGAVLATIPLAPTVGLAARPPLSRIPDRTAFGSAFRAFRWTSAAPLTERSNAVLSRYFAYEPREVDDVTEVATTFTPIKGAGARPAVGRLAMLITFPYLPKDGAFGVRVRTVVEEGRSKSDEYRPASDPELLKAANAFVDQVTRELGLVP